MDNGLIMDQIKDKELEEGRVVTLIGSKLAREGEEFIFWGPSKKCEECRLKNSCMNLEVDRRYRIEKVRSEIKHECSIHEDGVCVVEVAEPSIMVAIDATYAFKNSKFVFEDIGCKESGCELFDSCHPPGLRGGDSCTILDVIGDAPSECKKGWILKVVAVRREGAK
jgi:uncharacterized protein (UPF0179 family)